MKKITPVIRNTGVVDRYCGGDKCVNVDKKVKVETAKDEKCEEEEGNIFKLIDEKMQKEDENDEWGKLLDLNN